jgi:dUTP pyrophosphatase
MTTLRIAFNPEHAEFLHSVYGSKTQFASDVGFDLYLPEDVEVQPGETKFINLGIKVEYSDPSVGFLGYHLYPRSSISKTKLRLANSVGIIDPNYRGYLIAAVDNISLTAIQRLSKGDRLFQLVFVQMTSPQHVQFVSQEELSTTDRAEGGFGSTGK